MLGMCPESCRKASWRKAPADWLTTLPRYAAWTSHDIAVIGRIKGPPSQLVAVIDQVVSQSASTRVRVERRALEAVFSNIEGLSLHDVPDEDLFPSSVLGHRWIVGVAPEAWGEAVTAATSLDRNRMGVAVTLVCVTGDVMLPIALGVSWTNDGFMSVPPEEVSRIAGKLNRRTVPSGRRRFFSDVMDGLSSGVLEGRKDASTTTTVGLQRGLDAAGTPSASAAAHARRKGRARNSSGFLEDSPTESKRRSWEAT